MAMSMQGTWASREGSVLGTEWRVPAVVEIDLRLTVVMCGRGDCGDGDQVIR